MCLPGAFCLYQGDELGLTEARIPEDIPVEQIKDPFGQALYPAIKGRDGSRTPMPWKHDALNAGFTTAEEPWLPLPEDHYARAIDLQNRDPNSLLNTWRSLMHWRKKQPALEAGNLQILDTDEPIFAFIREYAEQSLLCVFNISDEAVEYDLSSHSECRETKGLRFTTEREGDRLKLPAYGVFFGNLRLDLNAAVRDWKNQDEETEDNGSKERSSKQKKLSKQAQKQKN
jgi:alpha-glucosidase